MRNRYKTLLLLAILLISGLSFSYLFLPHYFQSIDNKLRDIYFNVRGPEAVSNHIVIIDIDEKSIKSLGQWPWERDKITQIITNLGKSGAGIIGVDIIFSEADKTSPHYVAKKWKFSNKELPNYDKLLATTIAQTPTILSYIFDFDSTLHQKDAPNIPALFIEKGGRTQEFIPQAKGVLSNIPLIQNASYSSGFVNYFPDSSGVIRSVPLVLKYKDSLYPSLALEMYRISQNSKRVTAHYSSTGIETIEIGNEHIKTDRFARLHINFKGPAKSYKYISALDIYDNTFNADDISGKFIFIGTSAYALMDLRSSPMDKTIAGVELHANLLDNLLNKDLLTKPNWAEGADLAFIITIVFIVLMIYTRFSIIPFALLSVSSFMILVIFNYYLLFYMNIILNSFFPIVTLVLSLGASLAFKYLYEHKQKEMIKNSFSKKVSKQVMNDLLRHLEDTDLSTKEVEATIYFSDIRNFTSISEDLASPKRITGFLNYYLNTMVNIIEKHHGTIDKFIGDAVMAYWNAPLEIQNHADKAVLTALEQIDKRHDLNKLMTKQYGFEMDYGIGINTGNVVVGEIGSQGRSDYTIIGDAVNLASRVEGLCKPYKVRLIITEATKKQLTKEFVIQFLDFVRVKGKKEPIKIYEVLHIGKAKQEKIKELELYEKAHQLYLNMHFLEAQEAFEILYKKYEKYLYKLYKERSLELSKSNIQEFNGVYTYTNK